MNEQARKKARRAELEDSLLATWKERSSSRMDFAEWLEGKSVLEGSVFRRDAKELIALYEGEL